MNSKPVLVSTLAVAVLVVILLSLILLLRPSNPVIETVPVVPREPAPAAEVPKQNDSSEIDALRQEVARLEAKVAQLEKEKAQAEASPPAEEKSPEARTLDVFRNILTPPELAEKNVQELQVLALDRSKPAEERVKALRALRFKNGGRSREVVQEMLLLAPTLSEARLRRDIYRQLSEAVPLDLKNPVIVALQTDGDSRTREEAAETLGPLRADPAVEAALRAAASGDADRDVREEAEKSLAGEND